MCCQHTDTQTDLFLRSEAELAVVAAGHITTVQTGAADHPPECESHDKPSMHGRAHRPTCSYLLSHFRHSAGRLARCPTRAQQFSHQAPQGNPRASLPHRVRQLIHALVAGHPWRCGSSAAKNEASSCSHVHGLHPQSSSHAAGMQAVYTVFAGSVQIETVKVKGDSGHQN